MHTASTPPTTRFAARYAVALLALSAAPVLAYWRVLDRGFVSEDFLILRIVSETSIWEGFVRDLTSGWMGVDFVRFYRPMATLLLGIYHACFGLNPFPYYVGHLLVHLLSTLLVFGIGRQLFDGGSLHEPFMMALLFSLYPLQANAVSFVAASGALHAAFFMLLGIFLFSRYRLSGDSRLTMFSLGAFVLALMSYEVAVVQPALLLLVLLGREGNPAANLRSWSRSLAPYFGVTALYFVARRVFLGTVVGGYGHAEIAMASWRPWLLALLQSYPRMLWPSYSSGHGIPDVFWIALVLLVLIAVCLVTNTRSLPGSQQARLVLVGLLWMAIGQAPFLFPAVVPANARYWYLASVGLALTLTALAAWLGVRLQGVARRLGPLPVWLLLAGWGVLLHDNLELYQSAGRLSRVIQESLRAAAELRAPGAPIFVAGVPGFVTTDGGSNAAQLYRWGLKDVLRPPFSDTAHSLFRLPSSMESASSFLAEPRPEGMTSLFWVAELESFVAAEETPSPVVVGPPIERLRLLRPRQGERISLRRSESLSATFLVPTCAQQVRLETASSVGYRELLRIPEERGAGTLSLPLPRHVLEQEVALYEGTLWLRLEALDAAGRACARSPLRRVVAVE